MHMSIAHTFYVNIADKTSIASAFDIILALTSAQKNAIHNVSSECTPFNSKSKFLEVLDSARESSGIIPLGVWVQILRYRNFVCV